MGGLGHTAVEPAPRFALADEPAFAAWLASQPRALVLMRGVGCPYSATFEAPFGETKVPPTWPRAVREVEEGGHGPVAEGRRIDVTPTVVAFENGVEVARLDGKVLLGIPRSAFARFVKKLPA